MSTPPVVPAIADVVGDPTPTPNPAVVADDEPVRFDERQQRKIDEIVRSAQGRAAAETRQRLAEANRKLAEKDAELARAHAALSPDAPADAKVMAENDQLKAQIATIRAQATKDKIDNALLSAASEARFVNPAQALKLLRDNIRTNESGDIVVTDDDGNVIEGTSVQAFVAAYAQKNDHLVKGEVRPGSGSTPSGSRPPLPQYQLTEIFGKNSDARMANSLAIRDPQRYKAMRQEAVRKGLVS